MRNYLNKFSILALAAACANAELVKRDPYWIKMADVIKQVRPDFYFGVATTKSFFANPKYKDIISTYDLQVGGNECKFYTINGVEGGLNFKECDASINFAKKFGAKYRGHNLFWPANSPSWFKNYSKDVEENKKYILDYITKVLDYYKDDEDIIYWDVINESVTDDSTVDNIKLRTGSDNSNEFKGWDTYTEDIFTLAREHTNPNVKLFYNDYNAENNNGNYNGKTGAVFNYIKSMREKGIPIDGVGLQMHIGCNYYPNYDQLYSLISKYEEIGVEVHVTEIDVSMAKCQTHEQQRKLYMDVFKACFDHENCKVFTVWGSYDSESWIGAENVPLPFDEDMYPKDIYFDMLEYVMDQLPADATYPIPTSTTKPVTSSTPAASEANYLIKDGAYMIDPAWANWSWGMDSVDLNEDGDVVAVALADQYGAFSLHTDKEFTAGTLYFDLMIDQDFPVKVIVHTTKGDEFVTVETLEKVSTTKKQSFTVSIPAPENDTYNRVSLQDAWGKALTLTVNNYYFVPAGGNTSGNTSSSGERWDIVKEGEYMINPAWSNWSWGMDSVDLNDDGDVVAVALADQYGAFSLHTDKKFTAGTLYFDLMIDQDFPVKVLVHTTNGDEFVTVETLENVSTTKKQSFEVSIPAPENDTYNRISLQDAWGKALTLTINNYYFVPAGSNSGNTSGNTSANGNRYDIIKEGEYMLNGKWQNWSWGVDSAEFDDDGNFVAQTTAGTYGGVSFKRSDSVKFAAGTLNFKAMVNDTTASIQILFHTTADEYVGIETISKLSDKEMKQYSIAIPKPEAELYDRITIQDVSNNGLTITLNDVYFVDAVEEQPEQPEPEQPEQPEPEQPVDTCWATKLGYKCCSSTTRVIFEDEDGEWGVEDGEWCGFKVVEEEDTCWSTKLGYPCCVETNVIYSVDADGSWGYENDNWCGITKAQEKCEFSALGYTCCPDNEVIFEDEHKWGSSNGQWCGVEF